MKLKKILFFCGILSSILYISTDIFAATQLKGYSYLHQSISELSAIGASTRPLWIMMLIPYSILLIAFGIGVWKATHKKSLRISGVLLILWGLLGYVWILFPMHMRGSIGSTTDTMHLVMAGITVPLIMFFIGFGSDADGKRFRIYSILTIVVMIIFGILVARQAPAVAAQSPTPWMGVMERICVYSPMVWVIVLAVVLGKKQNF